MISGSTLVIGNPVHSEIVPRLTNVRVVVFLATKVAIVGSTAAVWAAAKSTLPRAVVFRVEP
jgi:hypothetical protein